MGSKGHTVVVRTVHIEVKVIKYKMVQGYMFVCCPSSSLINVWMDPDINKVNINI